MRNAFDSIPMMQVVGALCRSVDGSSSVGFWTSKLGNGFCRPQPFTLRVIRGASPIRRKGCQGAKRLENLVPGSGHLVHMPGHIYIRLGGTGMRR